MNKLSPFGYDNLIPGIGFGIGKHTVFFAIFFGWVNNNLQFSLQKTSMECEPTLSICSMCCVPIQKLGIACTRGRWPVKRKRHISEPCRLANGRAALVSVLAEIEGAEPSRAGKEPRRKRHGPASPTGRIAWRRQRSRRERSDTIGVYFFFLWWHWN